MAVDFAEHLVLPPMVEAGARLFFYPGSSIGNFSPDEALRFLRQVRTAGGDDARLVIGVDLVKDAPLLDAAYDDALGVTAAFNRNLLNHVNRLAGTDFDVRDWRHVAFFNSAASRIEMHLEARREVQVRVPAAANAGGRPLRFAAATASIPRTPGSTGRRISPTCCSRQALPTPPSGPIAPAGSQ